MTSTQLQSEIADESSGHRQALPKRSGRIWGSALVALAMALAACGSSTPSASSAPSSKSSPSVNESKMLLRNAAISNVTGPSFGPIAATQIVPWKVSAMPTPAPLATGKHISLDVVYGIPVGATPYGAHLFAALGAKLGWSVKIIVAAAQTQAATLAAMEEALLNKPTAIIGEVVPGVWVGPALTQAANEGIFTIDWYQDSTDGPGYSAYVPDGEGIQKVLLSAYAVSSSGGNANSLLVTAPGFSDSDVAAASSYLATCTGCKTETTQLNPTDFTNPVTVASDVTSLVAAHPGIQYLMWPNGSLPLSSIVTSISSSANPNVRLLVNAAAPAPVSLLHSGSIPLLVEAPPALMDLVTIDDINRLVEKKSPLPEDSLRFPIGYWTKANAPSASGYTAITKAQLGRANFLAPYEKAWGVSLVNTVVDVNS